MSVLSGFLILVLIVVVVHRGVTGRWLGESKGGTRTRTRVKRGRWKVVRRRTIMRRRTVRGKRRR